MFTGREWRLASPNAAFSRYHLRGHLVSYYCAFVVLSSLRADQRSPVVRLLDLTPHTTTTAII